MLHLNDSYQCLYERPAEMKESMALMDIFLKHDLISARMEELRRKVEGAIKLSHTIMSDEIGQYVQDTELASFNQVAKDLMEWYRSPEAQKATSAELEERVATVDRALGPAHKRQIEHQRREQILSLTEERLEKATRQINELLSNNSWLESHIQ